VDAEEIHEVNQSDDCNNSAGEQKGRGGQKARGEALAWLAFKPSHDAGKAGASKERHKSDPEFGRVRHGAGESLAFLDGWRYRDRVVDSRGGGHYFPRPIKAAQGFDPCRAAIHLVTP
jgi:hypothetical protein